MVSINPYKKLSLYTPDVIDKYRSHCLNQLPPHMWVLPSPQLSAHLSSLSYSLADRAWHLLRDNGQDQAVILTGESGAGKTEAGKLVMQYIAAVTGHSRINQDIKYQLLQANPVLEGKASTPLLVFDWNSTGCKREINLLLNKRPISCILEVFITSAIWARTIQINWIGFNNNNSKILF